MHYLKFILNVNCFLPPLCYLLIYEIKAIIIVIFKLLIYTFLLAIKVAITRASTDRSGNIWIYLCRKSRCNLERAKLFSFNQTYKYNIRKTIYKKNTNVYISKKKKLFGGWLFERTNKKSSYNLQDNEQQNKIVNKIINANEKNEK